MIQSPIHGQVIPNPRGGEMLRFTVIESGFKRGGDTAPYILPSLTLSTPYGGGSLVYKSRCSVVAYPSGAGIDVSNSAKLCKELSSDVFSQGKAGQMEDTLEFPNGDPVSPHRIVVLVQDSAKEAKKFIDSLSLSHDPNDYTYCEGSEQWIPK